MADIIPSIYNPLFDPLNVELVALRIVHLNITHNTACTGIVHLIIYLVHISIQPGSTDFLKHC